MVHALQRIRAVLSTGGLVVDTQPVSPQPAVEGGDGRLGALDMREWLGTVRTIDRLVEQTVEAGLYALETERRFVVTDEWDHGAECLETVANWQQTVVPAELAKRLSAVRGPVSVHQDVRLRLLRALG